MLRKSFLNPGYFQVFEVCEEKADWLESQGFSMVFLGDSPPPIFVEKGAVVGHA